MLRAVDLNEQEFEIPFPTSVQEFPKYVPTADPPIPPNWTDLCNNTIPTKPFRTFYKFPLAPDSVEYQTLAWMIEPSSGIQITGIEQIVNEELWGKFLTHRKDMMLNKCRDISILSSFNLSDENLAKIVSINLNSDPRTGTALDENMQYSDNVCLLFHCTSGDPETIFEEGLDERVGNPGVLGRGIYFSDDPVKAMKYDGTGETLLVFMVYLGDCLATTEIPNVKQLTREPEKFYEQSYTDRDRTFDSIAGAPFRQRNEFVIYNRFQCVPVFSVKYVPAQNTDPFEMTQDMFYGFRRSLPEFIWKTTPKNSTFQIPGKSIAPSPLHAKTIFDLMKSLKDKIQDIRNPMPEPVYVVNQTNETESGSQPEPMEIDIIEEENGDAQEKLDFGLSQLIDIGFSNDELNYKLLEKHKLNIVMVIDELLNSNQEGTSKSSSSIQSN